LKDSISSTSNRHRQHDVDGFSALRDNAHY
jgi:hypothetical protein